MSIRWIRNVLIDGEKSTVEIQIGDKRIGDKCYTRVNEELEEWFENIYSTRDDIIAQGVDILKKRLDGKNITYPDGQTYDWK
ncbi:MAG: hypothetical protein ACLFQB_02255 [Chitinispirillaceae bacterium]